MLEKKETILGGSHSADGKKWKLSLSENEVIGLLFVKTFIGRLVISWYTKKVFYQFINR